MIEIYTDGSSRGNPGPGGYGFVVVEDGKIIDAISIQTEEPVTNNQMELCAVVHAMKRHGAPTSFFTPIVYSDSAYVVNTFTNWMYSWHNNGWIKSDKKTPENLKLIQEYYHLEQEGYKIELKKVKGHFNNEYNNLADKLATGEWQDTDIIVKEYKIKRREE